MQKPARYYVESWAHDPGDEEHPLETIKHDFDSLGQAKARFDKLEGVRIMERYNFTDAADEEDAPDDMPHGVMWDWEEREVHS